MINFEAIGTMWAPRLLSVLRIVAALLYMTHGIAKLLKYPPLPAFAKLELVSLIGLAGVLELVGGALLILGLFTRPVAFILSGQMAVAYFMARHKKLILCWAALSWRPVRPVPLPRPRTAGPRHGTRNPMSPSRRAAPGHFRCLSADRYLCQIGPRRSWRGLEKSRGHTPAWKAGGAQDRHGHPHPGCRDTRGRGARAARRTVGGTRFTGTTASGQNHRRDAGRVLTGGPKPDQVDRCRCSPCFRTSTGTIC